MTPARRDGQPVFQIEIASDGLIVLTLARDQQRPEGRHRNIGDQPGKNTTSNAIHRPAKMAAQRERAPEITFRAVELSDPPTGSPRNKPDAELAAPCG